MHGKITWLRICPEQVSWRGIGLATNAGLETMYDALNTTGLELDAASVTVAVVVVPFLLPQLLMVVLRQVAALAVVVVLCYC